MIALLLLLAPSAHAQDAPWEERLPGDAVTSDRPDPFGLQGVDLLPIGGRSGFSVGQASVLGPDGGTNAWAMHGRVRVGQADVRVGLPVASYRTPHRRTAALGNLTADVLWSDDHAHPEWQAGATVRLPTGGAYTWVNDADELWPGIGIDAVYQRRFGSGPTTGGVRTALGIHGPAAYAPFPDVYAKVEAAGVLDQRITEAVGFVGEASFAWWDVSPVDLTAMLRIDPVDNVRLRGGLTLPVASWAGWQPAPVSSGVRETTLRLELHTAH